MTLESGLLDNLAASGANGRDSLVAIVIRSTPTAISFTIDMQQLQTAQQLLCNSIEINLHMLFGHTLRILWHFLTAFVLDWCCCDSP